MSKRKLLPLALLLLAALALAGALLLLQSGTPAENETVPLCPLAAETVEHISYTAGDTAAELEKNGDGQWEIVSDPLLPLDQDTVQSMVESICALQAARALDTTPTDAEMGLDAPAIRLTLTDGAQEFALTVGAQNAVSDESYARVGETVCMIDSAALSGLCHSPRALYAPQQVSATASADLAGFTVENGGDPLDFTWAADSESWRLTDDAAYALDQTAVGRMVNTVCNMQSVWSITAPEEDAAYGLDAPNATVTARRTDGSRVVLRFGFVVPDENSEGAGVCYVACDAAPGVVYEVEAEHLSAFAYTKAALAAPENEEE